MRIFRDGSIQIEKLFLEGDLPDGNGMFGSVVSNKKQTWLTQHDFKMLYGLRLEDLNYLANQVEAKAFCVKNTKVKFGLGMISLLEPGHKERLIRVMKTELLSYYEEHLLLMRNHLYVPYPASKWDDFVAKHKIG